jgi:D-amino-acid dehydrogenase
MLSQTRSPLTVKPAYALRIIPWLIRFLVESRQTRVEQNARDLHALTCRAIEGWQQLTDGTELSKFIENGGWLKVYESGNDFAATEYARALMDANGTPYEILGGPEIQDLEPQLAPIFQRGIYQSDTLRLTNPDRMVRGMVDLLCRRGGLYQQFDVEAIRPGNVSVELQGLEKTLSADKVIIAAGAWSKRFSHQLGDRIPLDTERGYHLMLPSPGSRLLNRVVFNATSSFVLSPMETGIRMTSQIEFAGLDAAPDYRWIRSLLPTAKRMLPNLDATETSVWMGCRPSLPDSLPVLGVAANTDRVFYAFGHQHLGITLGPISGLMIADLVAGRDPAIDLAPYRPNRF